MLDTSSTCRRASTGWNRADGNGRQHALRRGPDRAARRGPAGPAEIREEGRVPFEAVRASPTPSPQPTRRWCTPCLLLWSPEGRSSGGPSTRSAPSGGRCRTSIRSSRRSAGWPRWPGPIVRNETTMDLSSPPKGGPRRPPPRSTYRDLRDAAVETTFFRLTPARPLPRKPPKAPAMVAPRAAPAVAQGALEDRGGRAPRPSSASPS